MIAGGNFTFDPSFNVNQIDSSKTTGVFDLSVASEAVAEDAFIHSPTRSMYELARNHGFTGEDEGATLSKADLSTRKQTQFYAQFMTMPDEGMTEREYNDKYEAIRAEKLRENAIMRAPDTVGQFLKTLGVSLGTSVLDPTSIALGYMPAALARGGYLGVRAAQTAERFDASMEAAQAGGRAVLRAKAGAVGGTFEGVVAEAPVYFAANERGEKYGASEVFNSIATGVVVGSMIQVGGGALYDLGTIEARAFQREKIRVDESLRLQKIADKETDIKLKAEKQAAADAYKKQVADSKATPEHLRKFEDPDFVGPASLQDLEDLMLHSFIKASEGSGIQRKLVDYTAEERASLMQSGLSQFIQGNRVLGHEFVQTFEARRLGDRYRPGDVEAVRAEVVREQLQRQRDDLQELKLTPEEFKSGQTINNKVQAQIKEAREAIKGEKTVVTKGLRGKKLKAAQKKLSEQQARLKEAHLKLRVLESGLQGVKKVDAGNAKRIRELETQQRNIDEGLFPSDVNRAINTEVQRRMAIIDEIHLPKTPEYNMGKQTDLSQGIKKTFTDMKAKVESPEASRTYRPNAEAQQTKAGRRTDPSQDAQKLEQEKTDAIANAQKLAEDNDGKYELTKQEQALVDEVENMKVAADRLAVCMGRAA